MPKLFVFLIHLVRQFVEHGDGGGIASLTVLPGAYKHTPPTPDFYYSTIYELSYNTFYYIVVGRCPQK